MNKFIFKTRYGTFERISKTKARNLFVKEHKTIYIVTDKWRCDYTHPLTYPASIDYKRCKKYFIDDIGANNFFTNLVNSFEFYNCNYECGYHASFYLKTDISMGV